MRCTRCRVEGADLANARGGKLVCLDCGIICPVCGVFVSVDDATDVGHEEEELICGECYGGKVQ